MKFCIISHAIHKNNNGDYFAYAPYVREMNLWTNEVNELIIVAPLIKNEKCNAIDLNYNHKKITFIQIPNFNIISKIDFFRTLFLLPILFYKVFKAMNQADHIHLRCPGNIALIGCFVQIFFPKKSKTAKYAGNWDPKAPKPWSYKLQKWIVSNTILTKNMRVLIYGKWEKMTKNNFPFFTASYRKKERLPLGKRNFTGKIKFIYVGTLTEGKNPLYAIQLVESLYKKGFSVNLSLYGDGLLYNQLEEYILKNKLEKIIFLQGNKDAEILKKAYLQSHFVILPSKSEGWPKAIAEGMFWGCVPIAQPISCIPYMFREGERGVFLKMNLERDSKKISFILNDEIIFNQMQENAYKWAQEYTLELFESEIKKIILS